MAAPSQNIPLGSTNFKSLVRDLSKERQKLEREVEKSLNAVGRADGELIKRLRELNRREADARAALSTQGTIRGLRGLRGDARDLRGVMDLMTGRGGIGDIRDLSEVLESASARMARSGYARAASMASKAATVAGQVATAAGSVMAAVAVAQAGFEVGSLLQPIISGWMAGDSGDPTEIQNRAKQVNNLQRRLDANRKILGDKKYAEILGLTVSTPEKAERELKRALMTDAEKQQYIKLARERRGMATWYDNMKNDLGNGWDKMWDNEAQKEWNTKEDNDRYEKWKEQTEYDKAKRLSDWRNTTEGLRTRTLQNIRLVGLRKIEEQKWSGVKDWSI